jgi:hypothetical protein
MPQARPATPPVLPAPVKPDEARFIRDTVKRFYGENAIVRSYGPDPKRLLLHVETDIEPGMEQHDCLGVLMCEINRDQISLSATKRGRRIFGDAKLAYRQGEILI